MPRLKALETYPNFEYWELTQRVLKERSIQVDCHSKMAATLRGQYYAWRRVCEQLPEEAARYGVDAEKLREVSIRQNEAGLEFMWASDLPIPGLIRSALGIAPGPVAKPAPSEGEQSLRRIQEMLKGEAPKATGVAPYGEDDGQS